MVAHTLRCQRYTAINKLTQEPVNGGKMKSEADVEATRLLNIF